MPRPTYAELRESATKIKADLKALRAKLRNAWCTDVSTLANHREACAHLEHAHYAMSSLGFVLSEVQDLSPADMAEAEDAIARG